MKTQTGWEDAKVTSHGSNESQIGGGLQTIGKAVLINPCLILQSLE